MTDWTQGTKPSTDFTAEGTVTSNIAHTITPSGGYLKAGSGISWADCLDQITDNVSTNGDLGDDDYVEVGKANWEAGRPPTDNWGIWQTFLKVDCSDITSGATVTEATLRLYIDETPDTNFAIFFALLAATYGTLDKTDWHTAGGTSATVNTSTIDTDAGGNSYIDIALSAAQRATIPLSDSFVYICLRHNDQSTEPTDYERIKCYSPTYATSALRPYLSLDAQESGTPFTQDTKPTTISP